MHRTNKFFLIIVLLITHHIVSAIINVVYVSNYANDSISIYYELENNRLYKTTSPIITNKPLATEISPNKRQLYVLQSIPYAGMEKAYSWDLDQYGFVKPDLPPHVFYTQPYAHQIVFIPNTGRNRVRFPYYAYIVSNSGIAIHRVNESDIISENPLKTIPGLNSTSSMTTFNFSGSYGMNEIYVYITDSYHNTIKMYRVIGKGASLEPLEESAEIVTGAGPVKSILSPDGKYLYVVCATEKSIYTYRINYLGKLINVSKTSTFDLSPVDMQIDFFSAHAFVAAQNLVLAYSIKQDDSLQFDETASKQVGLPNTQITAMKFSNRTSLADSTSKLYVTSAERDELSVFELKYAQEKPWFNLLKQQVLTTGYYPIGITVWHK